MEKIIPNEIYIINKLNFVSQVNVITRICMTLKYAEKEPIDPHIFLKYVSMGLAFGKCIILVTFDEKQDLNSCVVLFLKNNQIQGKILWIEWAWSNSKDLTLGLKVFKKIEDLAQKLKADKIAGSMTRGLKAVSKKYGLKTAYTVMEKIIKKGSELNVEQD